LKPFGEWSNSTRNGIIFRGTVTLSELQGTFLDLSCWRRGYVWVNRQLLTKTWTIGESSNTLVYLPKGYMVKGENEILILDFARVEGAFI
jgi:beta-galactosidase